MTSVVLDASAALAYLTDEKGAAQVEGYLKAGSCMSAANWAEVISKISDLGMNYQELEKIFRQRGLIEQAIKFFPLTLEDAKTIGGLRSITKKFGLSLADRACLALAIRLNLPAVTADSSWLKLKHAIRVISIR